MVTKVKIDEGETIEITSQFKESVKGWVKDYGYNNSFLITVKNGSISESFVYHISIDETKKGKTTLMDDDHISAFYSFIGDAIAGLMDFDEFVDEYGYTDCRKAYKIHKLCEKAQKQVSRLGLGDLYELSNKIQKKYPDVI